jgi:hypothetical protein
LLFLRIIFYKIDMNTFECAKLEAKYRNALEAFNITRKRLEDYSKTANVERERLSESESVSLLMSKMPFTVSEQKQFNELPALREQYQSVLDLNTKFMSAPQIKRTLMGYLTDIVKAEMSIAESLIKILYKSIELRRAQYELKQIQETRTQYSTIQVNETQAQSDHAKQVMLDTYKEMKDYEWKIRFAQEDINKAYETIQKSGTELHEAQELASRQLRFIESSERSH